MQRLAQDTYFVLNIVPLKRTSEGDVNGTGVDCGGYEAVLAHCPIGFIGLGCKADFKLQESDDDSTWTDIVGAVAVQLGAIDDDKCPTIDARLRKKYVRAVHTVTATVGVCAGVVLQFYRSHPIPVVNDPVSVVV